jgi:formylglycine-generating enzyme required for sulfatase activity/predicted Ser/Thr protein kinase
MRQNADWERLQANSPSHPSIPQRELSQSDFPFTLGQKLGEGAMGAVFEAWQDGKKVAIKLLNPSSDVGTRERFQRECAALEALDSPHAPRFLARGEIQGRAWIAMSHIEGRSLEEIVQREGPMELLAALQLLNPIAELLAECHAKGISHRDVKPENIVISKLEGERHAVLVDFGLVKIRRGLDSTVSGDGQSLTATGTMLGTPAFMAPEQLAAKSELGQSGPEADVWSLAATLFFVFSGSSPLEALESANPLMALAVSEMPTLRNVCPNAPPKLERLLARCFTKERLARPKMDELHRELEKLLDELENPEAARASIALVASLALALALLSAALLAVLFGGASLPEVELSWTGLVELSKEPKLALTIKASDHSALLVLRRETQGELFELGHRRLLDRESWELELELPDGEHLLSVEVAAEARAKAPLTGRVRVNACDPEVQSRDSSAHRDHSLLVFDSEKGASCAASFLITDSGSAPEQLSVRLNGAPQSLTGAGLLNLRIEDMPTPQRFAVTVNDGAERTARRDFLVVTRACLDRIEHALKEGGEAWDKLDAGSFSALDRLLSMALGLDYRPLGPGRSRRGELSWPYLRYTHSRTGVLLHVIPGGEFTMGLGDVQAHIAACAANLAWWNEALKNNPPAAAAPMITPSQPQKRVRVGAFLVASRELDAAAWSKAFEEVPRETLEDLWRQTFDDGMRAATAQRRLSASSYRETELPRTLTEIEEDGLAHNLSYLQIKAWLACAGGELRLPKEAEWEYAARAGSTTLTPTGDEIDSYQPMYSGGPYQDRKKLSSSERANAFGLSETIGSWWEWCEGSWTPNLAEPASPAIEGSALGVLRGGARYWPRLLATSASRMHWPKYQPCAHAGFRPARSLPDWRGARRSVALEDPRSR